MIARFALRDALILGGTLVLWWLFAAASAGEGMAADLAGWVVGLACGACAYLAHEWSHYLGAVATGSRVEPGGRLASGFLFHFQAEGNSLGQFVAMSLAGFAATAAAIWFFYTGLPDEYLATRVARGGAMFLALLAVTLEVPLLLLGLFKGRVPEQAAAQPAGTSTAGSATAPELH